MQMRRFSLLALALITMLAGVNASGQADIATVTILNTSDEHGWLQPSQPFGSDRTLGGAANIFSYWVEYEGYSPDTHLLLSGGDNWTGPSISTWFEGRPMIEVFNLMGYDASAIGNHEFDFGRDIMAQRFAEADYPYLAANIRLAESGELLAPPFAVFEVNGVQVGVIGLTTTATTTTTHPRNIDDLAFTDYVEALEIYVPTMRQDGAQIVVALTHVCRDELAWITPQVAALIDIMFTGHCNQAFVTDVSGVTIVGSGERWQSYATVTVDYDLANDAIAEIDATVVGVEYVTADGNPVTPDPTIAALVDSWQTEVDAVLSEEIGYSVVGIPQRSPAMGKWVTDAWLWAYPSADVAITNWGGFRQAIDAGPITLGEVVGVLPFDNFLYEIEITGEQLLANLRCCGGALGGITYSGGEISFNDGRIFDAQATYTVLISDFMYFGGDDYLFGQQDPDPYNTNIHWRQPVIDYTVALGTTAANPLEDYLLAANR